MAQNIRPMAVAGQFYAASRQELTKDVAQCYKTGEGLLAASKVAVKSNEKVQAVVVPHAGYVFSGGVAASAFAAIPKEATYKHIFLLGPLIMSLLTALRCAMPSMLMPRRWERCP